MIPLPPVPNNGAGLNPNIPKPPGTNIPPPPPGPPTAPKIPGPPPPPNSTGASKIKPAVIPNQIKPMTETELTEEGEKTKTPIEKRKDELLSDPEFKKLHNAYSKMKVPL